MIESILYKTAIYCRLSLDDGSLGVLLGDSKVEN